MGFTYKDSGVDIDAADLSVQMIKRYARQTHIDGVLGDIGNFGAFFQLG
ncbi:MAG TPA: phosphoribosylformylglycinamidine cyclo-ligase, partial [Pseudothermotoga sp.]|nr:phosphoribosylformylglycinamidine cyclo-ligase [Pseudothermotoga sp.]